MYASVVTATPLPMSPPVAVALLLSPHPPLTRLVELYRNTTRPATAQSDTLSPLEVSTYSKLDPFETQDAAVDVGVKASLGVAGRVPPIAVAAVCDAAKGAEMDRGRSTAPSSAAVVKSDVKLVTLR